MSKTTTATHAAPADELVDAEVLEFRANFDTRSPLDEIVCEGARNMLQAAIDAEVEGFIAQHADRRDEQGRRQVVRNGQLPSREILTGAGPLEVVQPRVRDRSPDKDKRVTFSPSVLPPYLRKSKAIEELIPWLYLKGVSTGDFGDALQSLVGEGPRDSVQMSSCVSRSHGVKSTTNGCGVISPTSTTSKSGPTASMPRCVSKMTPIRSNACWCSWAGEAGLSNGDLSVNDDH